MNETMPQSNEEVATEEEGLAAMAGEQVEVVEDGAVSVAKQTMVGDMRDVCLQIIRDPKLTGKAWKDMNESEQKDVVSQITNRMEYAVVKAVQVIAADGDKRMTATLEQVVIKDGVKAVLKCSKHDELFHRLCDAEGEAVDIILSGAEEYIGVGNKVKIDKDQKDLLENEEETPADEDTDETPQQEGQEDGDTSEPEGQTEAGDDSALERESAELT